ncbi:MAG: sialate O-acetylesterase [Planctomycetota bacterium]|jgi:sialate O-acetylesterase
MSQKKRCFNRSIVRICSLALLQVCAAASVADVSLPAVIGDNMVLQQDAEIPIWGWADPGERVEIEIRLRTQAGSYATVADNNGRWVVKIQPLKPRGPLEMTVRGKNTITIRNILVGEVWVCSGQSNMAWSVGRAANSEQEIAAADYPQIRLFTVERNASGHPLNDCVGSWSECSPDTVAKFSAVAYFFGRKLHKELNVPIGLINTSWGGTRVEPWTPPAGFASVPKLQEIQKQVGQADSEYRKTITKSLDTIEAWARNTRKALAADRPLPATPAWPAHPLSSHRRPTGLYNAMVHPLVPFAMRGAIWYQGESNREDGLLYYEKMKALINGWRIVWQQGAFPFYLVQLAPFRYGGDPVITDIGNLSDIHPRNKQDVGKRLALWALARSYGRAGLVYSGPLCRSMSVEGNKVRIRFDHVGSGLASRDGQPLNWFTIAAADNNFVEAKAKIEGDTVLVWSDGVARPVAVRFGWHQEAEPNLTNKEGLPASPFRTDNWHIAAAKSQ